MLNDAGIWKPLIATHRLTLFADPCAIAKEPLNIRIAPQVRKSCRRLGVNHLRKAGGGRGGAGEIAETTLKARNKWIVLVTEYAV